MPLTVVIVGCVAASSFLAVTVAAMMFHRQAKVSAARRRQAARKLRGRHVAGAIPQRTVATEPGREILAVEIEDADGRPAWTVEHHPATLAEPVPGQDHVVA